jgi:hypothetical protein
MLIRHDKFGEHTCADDIEKRVLAALPYFPELDDVPITLCRFGTQGASAIALANYWKGKLGFNIEYCPSNVTIFHELGHFLQHHVKEIPSGEIAASIFGCSRMPREMVDSNCLPYVGLVPLDSMTLYCQRAILERNTNKNRRYIKWMLTRIQQDRDNFPLIFPKEDCYTEQLVLVATPPVTLYDFGTHTIKMKVEVNR